jgi:hypothetical protein
VARVHRRECRWPFAEGIAPSRIDAGTSHRSGEAPRWRPRGQGERRNGCAQRGQTRRVPRGPARHNGSDCRTGRHASSTERDRQPGAGLGNWSDCRTRQHASSPAKRTPSQPPVPSNWSDCRTGQHASSPRRDRQPGAAPGQLVRLLDQSVRFVPGRGPPARLRPEQLVRLSDRSARFVPGRGTSRQAPPQSNSVRLSDRSARIVPEQRPPDRLRPRATRSDCRTGRHASSPSRDHQPGAGPGHWSDCRTGRHASSPSRDRQPGAGPGHWSDCRTGRHALLSRRGLQPGTGPRQSGLTVGPVSTHRPRAETASQEPARATGPTVGPVGTHCSQGGASSQEPARGNLV